MKLTLKQIIALQVILYTDKYQHDIDTGIAWKTEQGYINAMEYLDKGMCFLPLKSFIAFNRTLIPSRTSLTNGTKGTLSLSSSYYTYYYNKLIS